ncbi:SDR family oxidoreductase [Nocardia vinacea]|uniref:SDR family oxidoreductase n=1 Tax=Nocardia vinacea TaxID=96468 RepID=UPI0009FBBEBB|nr:SDR family oxidoreductase [Nocardia vinacea]
MSIDDGIRCNALLPGPVRTEGVADKHDVDPKGLERLKPLFALQQRRAEPHQMADVVLLLASDAASYINGAVLPVDGGCSTG